MLSFLLLLLTQSDNTCLPGGQLVDVAAAVLRPDDDSVCGDELSSGPGLVALTGH